MSSLETKLASREEQHEEHCSELKVLREENAELKEVVKCGARVEDVERLSCVLCRVEEQVKCVARKKELHKVERTQKLISDTINELSVSMIEGKKGNKKVLDGLVRKVDDKISKQDIDQLLSSTSTINDLMDNHNDLEKQVARSKASQSDLTALVQELREQNKALESKVDLTVKFIEWFSDRDDACDQKDKFLLRDPTAPERATVAAQRLASIRTQNT